MNTKVTTLEEMRPGQVAPGQAVQQRFDPDAWHAMQARDDMLIRDEILHGSTAKEFVYEFKMKDGSTVRGISVVGARQLANFYGGIQSRIVASVDKFGALFVFKSFEPLAVMAQRVPELADEPDFYEVVIDVRDIKTGNSTQVRKKEFKTETRSAARGGTTYDRPHFDVIAESKAKRNGILEVIPQDVKRSFMDRCLKVGDVKQERTINDLRTGCLAFAAKNAIALDRGEVEQLTYEQLYGIGQAAGLGVVQFAEACQAVGISAREMIDTKQEPPPKEQPPAEASK